jgi:hypothetical protein
MTAYFGSFGSSDGRSVTVITCSASGWKLCIIALTFAASTLRWNRRSTRKSDTEICRTSVVRLLRR